VPESGRVVTGASLQPSKQAEEGAAGELPTTAETGGFVQPGEQGERMPRAAGIEGLVAESRAKDEAPASVEEKPLAPASVGATAAGPEVKSEEGREALRMVLEKVREAEARAKKEKGAQPEPSAVVLAPSSPEAKAESASSREAGFETPAASLVEERLPSRPEERAAERPVSSVAASAVSAAESEYLKDEKTRKFEFDIRRFVVERQQLEQDLDKTRVRFDAEVERYRAVADAKRARLDSAEREAHSAKKEWDDADKEYKNAEGIRKKELSVAEKRIDEKDKQIKKAEEAKKKRIEEIEKEKQKRAEEIEKEKQKLSK